MGRFQEWVRQRSGECFQSVQKNRHNWKKIEEILIEPKKMKRLTPLGILAQSIKKRRPFKDWGG